MAARFPEIRWSVTAGNASPVTDGASAALIVEEGFARRHGLTPRAAITHFALAGDDPIFMLTAIIPATRKLLARAGLRVDQIDAFEVNEAFASVVLAWAREFRPDMERVNAYGGAIALGHPVGASGARLLASAADPARGDRGPLRPANHVRIRRHGQCDADRAAVSALPATLFSAPGTGQDESAALWRLRRRRAPLASAAETIA